MKEKCKKQQEKNKQRQKGARGTEARNQVIKFIYVAYVFIRMNGGIKLIPKGLPHCYITVKFK